MIDKYTGGMTMPEFIAFEHVGKTYKVGEVEIQEIGRAHV